MSTTGEMMSTEYLDGKARSSSMDEHGVPEWMSTEYLDG